MRRALGLSVLLAGVAWADILPPDTHQCSGLKAGAACTTDAGGPGTCVAQQMGRRDYTHGVPPRVVQVEVLVCVSTASAKSVAPRALAIGWLSAMLLMVFLAGWAGRRFAR